MDVPDKRRHRGIADKAANRLKLAHLKVDPASEIHKNLDSRDACGLGVFTRLAISLSRFLYYTNFYLHNCWKSIVPQLGNYDAGFYLCKWA